MYNVCVCTHIYTWHSCTATTGSTATTIIIITIAINYLFTLINVCLKCMAIDLYWVWIRREYFELFIDV